jgi:hypothetical protein
MRPHAVSGLDDKFQAVSAYQRMERLNAGPRDCCREDTKERKLLSQLLQGVNPKLKFKCFAVGPAFGLMLHAWKRSVPGAVATGSFTHLRYAIEPGRYRSPY